ncbi:MAG: hypothetical protein ACUZ77_03885 [Candidatus Brocadiales bacterium]
MSNVKNKKGRTSIWKTTSLKVTAIVALIAFIFTAFYISRYSDLNPIRVGVFASILASILTGALCGIIHLITIFIPSSRRGIDNRE